MRDLRGTNLKHAACGRRLTYIGPVHVRALGMKATLCQCQPCNRLVAVYCGAPIWDAAIPAADLPAVGSPSGARETAPA